MALNLSTLTSSATSGDVLAEALTTADFLEGVPLVKNNARGSQAGGSAKQDVALNQPRALPLDVNGKGYCYLPVTTGNAPAVTFPTIGVNDDFVLEMVAYIVDVENFHVVSGSNYQRLLIFNSSGSPSFRYRDSSNSNSAALSGSLSAGLSTLRFEKTGSTLVFKQNGAVKGTINNITAAPTFTHLSFNGQFATSHLPLNGYIQTTTLSINGTEQLNIDFTATNVRHGERKFRCVTNQVVTINTAGLNPAKIIKRPVLRFDGVNDFLSGVFNQTITGSSIFMAYSVVGEGETSGRLLGLNSTGANDNVAGGYFLAREGSTTNVMARYNGGTNIVIHAAMYDDAVGDVLLEAHIKNGSQISKINNANKANGTTTVSGDLSSEEFKIACFTSGDPNAAIDLEFLALFSPDSVPDEATAKRIRNYINGRGVHPIFTLISSAAYYFYDGTRSPVGAISSGSSAWSGRVVGSDNGDSASLLATQATSNDAPVGDGFTVTFADNTDHIEIPSISQSGWQICGTSLGTFVYRVDSDAVTELNLLGNAGTVRSIGDLYGIILLPESATSADIESARRLLIDRGASDGVSGNTVQQFWQSRNDIVEFKQVDTSSVTSFREGWRFCPSLEIFPPLQAPNCTNFLNAWEGNSSLNSFGAIDASGGTTFTNAWKSCTSLTSFPAGAKLGTSASNVNFTSAWRSSGLTSFPALDLSNGNNFVLAFDACSNLTSLETGVSFSANASNIAFYGAFFNCTSLVDFPPGAFDGFGTPANDSFLNTWLGCSALSANSVENILVSIDTSGQSAPSSGPQITISYNTATGTPAYSTLASLKSKGWSIIVNNVTL